MDRQLQLERVEAWDAQAPPPLTEPSRHKTIIQGTVPRDPGNAMATLLRSLGVSPGKIPADLGACAAFYRDRLAGLARDLQEQIEQFARTRPRAVVSWTPVGI